MKHRFVVVGKGTSGAITATYLKAYWKDYVDVTIIHDSKQKTIGVGESLTPVIYDYLNFVGITREELIQHVNATVKLGLRFQNWTGDGTGFFHTFAQLYSTDGFHDPYNLASGYEISQNTFDNHLLYGNFLLENNLIPKSPSLPQSLHIDATLMSEYVLNRFKEKLEIIDGKIVDVIKKSNEDIEYLQLEDGRKIYGDFFIDASGFGSILFRSYNRGWIDRSDWMPLDSCIPNPTIFEHKHINPYTTAEASSEGWILQVPLQDRWGTGYLYSSQFTSDETAFEKFEAFLKQRFDKTLTNTSRIIKFKSGYWSEQWIGNCLAVGLSSGFAEPLEATNIHQTVDQIQRFVHAYAFKVFNFDRKEYNRSIAAFYDRVYDYVRFCYTGGRNDSEFWRYMNNNIPEQIKDIEEKIQTSIVNSWSWITDIFGYQNFTVVALGLNKINRTAYFEEISKRNAIKKGKFFSELFTQEKMKLNKNAVPHIDYIKLITNKT